MKLNQRKLNKYSNSKVLEGNDTDFKEHIQNILKQYADIADEHILTLTTESNMKQFKRAFTTADANRTFNYEFYEMLGDSTANNCCVWYFHRRFFSKVEQIHSSEGQMSELAIMGRLKQGATSTKYFSKFASKLNFLPFITMTESQFELSQKYVLEDVFEAFIGCLVYLADKEFATHIGFGLAYNILEKLYDSENFTTDINSLYDSKSLLNHDTTTLRKVGILIRYIHQQLPKEEGTDCRGSMFSVKIVVTDSYNNVLVESNEFIGSDKARPEQQAAKDLLQNHLFQKIKLEKKQELEKTDKITNIVNDFVES